MEALALGIGELLLGFAEQNPIYTLNINER
jgi:hypothetical protein